MTKNLVVNLYHRCQGTTAQAGYLLYRILLVVSRDSILPHVQFPTESIIDNICPFHMTGRSTADANNVLPVWNHSELSIESCDRNGLCTVDVCGLIDALQSIGRQIAELSLQSLK